MACNIHVHAPTSMTGRGPRLSTASAEVVLGNLNWIVACVSKDGTRLYRGQLPLLVSHMTTYHLPGERILDGKVTYNKTLQEKRQMELHLHTRIQNSIT